MQNETKILEDSINDNKLINVIINIFRNGWLIDSYIVQVFAFCLKAIHGNNVTKSKITFVILLNN